jgi:hypothetical protein
MATQIDTIDIFKKALKKFNTCTIANKLNISKSTVNRWIELNSVPRMYQFDLLKMNGVVIDYKKFDSKDKDQFFTPTKTAKYCYNIFCKKMKLLGEKEETFHYIEPSAGAGNFLEVLPKDRITALDIEPRNKNIKQQDYFDFEFDSNKKYCVFGNPPFGLRGNLALRFINHSNFAEFVCFILPQLFESDGKGVPRKRVKGLNLIHSEKIESCFYEPNKQEIKVNCIFQIWSKKHKNEIYNIKEIKTNVIKIYSLSDGGTPSSTRNKKMINKCDIYLPSTCFGKENMVFYNKFIDLPGNKGYGIVFNKDKNENLKKFKNIEWSKVAFLSTNSAYCIRTSQISSQFN